MPHGWVYPQGAGRVIVLAALLAALLVLATPGGANPLPPSLLLLHVQPEDPYRCAPPDVYDCRDLVQVTDASGDLEFIVFLQRGDPDPTQIARLDFTLAWGSGWAPTDLESCTDAEYTYELFGNEISLHFEWPDCPTFPPFQPICKLVVAVPENGCLEVTGNPTVDWGCAPHVWSEYPMVGKAQAGIDCDYACFFDCNGGEPCEPHLTPPGLHLEVPQGHLAQELLQSVISHYHSPCGLAVDATEPWIALEVVQTSPSHHDIYVTIDAAGLAVGGYDAWIRATSQARDCCPVHLTVIADPQSLPEDETPPADEMTRTTWGGVKGLYRDGSAR